MTCNDNEVAEELGRRSTSQYIRLGFGCLSLTSHASRRLESADGSRPLWIIFAVSQLQSSCSCRHEGKARGHSGRRNCQIPSESNLKAHSARHFPCNFDLDSSKRLYLIFRFRFFAAKEVIWECASELGSRHQQTLSTFPHWPIFLSDPSLLP